MPAGGASMVRLDGVSKHYGAVVALAPTELTVEAGEFVTLLGPSGSGKTTLLNLIAGMVAPTTGRISIAGRDVTDMPPNKRDLGMVFQNYALLPHMTIFENIAFPLRVRRLPEAEIRQKVSAVLELVQLAPTAARRPRELSGGQQQRCALARCLVYNPALILMDEPLGALDKKLREQMQLEIKKLHQRLGITILYVTHDQEEALSMSDRIVLLNQSRIVQIGTPADLYFRPRSVFAASFLGASNLLDATLSSLGPPAEVRLASGKAMRVASAADEQLGAAVRIMVRPESILLLRDNAETDLENRISATITASTILGGVVNHYAMLADGATLVVQELTRANRSHPPPGAAIELAWAAEDTLVLPVPNETRG